MSKVDQIESELKSIDQAKFQKLCDSYLNSIGYDVKSNGSVIGQNKTKKGTPDSYVYYNSKYIFIEYTTTSDKVAKKFLKDLESCFDEKKTKVKNSDIEKILLCCNSLLKPSEHKDLHDKCKEYGVACEIIDLDKLKFAISAYPELGIEFLDIKPDSGQILKLNDFIKEYSRGKFATPLDNPFYHRKEDLDKAYNLIQNCDLLIISGRAGVGKTRFSIELSKKYIKENVDCEFYCIHNKNHEDLYYEIQCYFKPSKKYIVLVDDANRLVLFRHVIQLLDKDSIDIKLLVTVRDYAKGEVQTVLKNNLYESIELNSFSDKEIRELFSDYSFNSKCLHRITSIAEGNPRLAMMAAKIAIETNSLEKLNNVYELYEEYFSDISKKIVDINLLKVVGILSFFRFLNKEEAEVTQKIYTSFNIEENIFWDKINELDKLEVVDLEMTERKWVKISDQILATFFLAKLFIKENLLDYSILLNNFFYDKKKIKDSTYSLYNALDYEQTNNRIIGAITTKLSYLIESQREDEILAFFEIFWYCTKSETIAYLKEKIESLPVINEPRYSFIKDKNTFPEKDKYFEILKLLCNHYDEYFEYSLDVILKYILRKPELLPKVLRFFEDDLTFDLESNSSDYFKENLLFDFLFNKREIQETSDLCNKIILKISNSFLKVNYTGGRLGRNREFSHYSFVLQSNKLIDKFRDRIWTFLLEQYSVYPEKVYSVFSYYMQHSELYHSSDIHVKDQKYIFNFFNRYLTNQYDHCKLVHTYIKLCQTTEILNEVYDDLKEKFSNDIYILSLVLDWNYQKRNGEYVDDMEEYETYKIAQLNKLYKSYTLEDYQKLFGLINKLLKVDPSTSTKVTRSIEVILINLLKKNSTHFFQLIERIISSEDNCNFVPLIPFFSCNRKITMHSFR